MRWSVALSKDKTGEDSNERGTTDDTDDTVDTVLDSMDTWVLDDTVLEWWQVVDKQRDKMYCMNVEGRRVNHSSFFSSTH